MTRDTTITPNKFTRYWHAWLITVAVSFGAGEALALRTVGESGTLTTHLRKTLGISPRRKWCAAGQGLMFVVFSWCIVHLVFGFLPGDGWWDTENEEY